MVDRQHDDSMDEQVVTAEEQIVEQSKRIDFYLTEYTIELLALKMQQGDFVVPEYQRKYTWEKNRKSRFIESIIMGLPIPFLFFWQDPETGLLEIVDGSQRLRTIEEYILGDLIIDNLKILSLLSRSRFEDLTVPRQRKIKNRSIRGIVLSEHADEEARFDLFDRINTGSKIANPAEVRRGTRRGPFLDLVISLTENPTFVNIAPVSEKQERERERDELITRFFAYSDGLDEYKDKVKSFLFDYAKKMNIHFEQNPDDVDIYRQNFLDTMDFVSRNFPLGFRKTSKSKTTPRARFESIAIGSFLALIEKPDLVSKVVEVESWLKSDEFGEIVGSDGANVKSKLTTRLYFVRDHLLGVSE
jgi:hypothetical protein